MKIGPSKCSSLLCLPQRCDTKNPARERNKVNKRYSGNRYKGGDACDNDKRRLAS